MGARPHSSWISAECHLDTYAYLSGLQRLQKWFGEESLLWRLKKGKDGQAEKVGILGMGDKRVGQTSPLDMSLTSKAGVWGSKDLLHGFRRQS